MRGEGVHQGDPTRGTGSAREEGIAGRGTRHLLAERGTCSAELTRGSAESGVSHAGPFEWSGRRVNRNLHVQGMCDTGPVCHTQGYAEGAGKSTGEGLPMTINHI